MPVKQTYGKNPNFKEAALLNSWNILSRLFLEFSCDCLFVRPERGSVLKIKERLEKPKVRVSTKKAF